MTDLSTGSFKSDTGGVLALGNFDGVHRGHQAVIKAAVERARALSVPACVITLEPHPRSLFKPNIPPFRLTPASVKERLLKSFGIDQVIVLPFTREFSEYPAPDFVQKILLDTYHARHIVAGFDFVFGKDRQGTMPRLREWLAPHHVGVTEVTPFRDASGEVMSSSRTRKALQSGDMKTVTHILGRFWGITGTVQQGAQRGRQLGVPTANIALGDYQRPKFGVYVVQAKPVGGGHPYQGVANIGVRPTVDGKTELLEVHLFNFFGDLYGQELEVELLHFLRPEKAFSGIDALRQQIEMDMQEARAWLTTEYQQISMTVG